MWDWLTGWGGDLLDTFDVQGTLQAIWQALVSVLTAIVNAIWAVLKAVADFLWSVLRAVGNALKYIWDNFFKGIFTRIWAALNRAWDWLEEKLGPVLRVLLKIRAWIDAHIWPLVKKFLNIVQHIRQVLLIFRLLHIKIAQAIDTELLKITRDVTGVFLTIRGTLNSVISVLEGLSDPRGLIRLILVTVAGRRVVAALTRSFTGLPLGYFWENTGSDAYPWEKRPSTAADLLDPERNPPPSVLLSGLADLPLSYFAEGDPIPLDAGIDADQPWYLYDQTLQMFLAADAAAVPSGPGGLDMISFVQKGTGNMASLIDTAQQTLDAVAPDVALAGA
jgi:hypothetical protein